MRYNKLSIGRRRQGQMRISPANPLNRFCQQVSYADFGENQLWMAGVLFKFLSQVSDIDPEAVDRPGMILPPDCLSKPGVSYHMTCVLHEVLHDTTLDDGKAYLLASVGQLVCGGVQSQ